jgi:pullulanase
MATFNEVQNNLHFLNTGQSQIPGVIVMKLDANGGNYGPFQHIDVVFNGSKNPVTFQSAALQRLGLHLRPVQALLGGAQEKQSSLTVARVR